MNRKYSASRPAPASEMTHRRGGLSRRAACRLLAGFALAAPTAHAQDDGSSPVLVVDMARIRTETAAGKDMMVKIEDIRRRVEADLGERAVALREEERKLAEERDGLSIEEFRERVSVFEKQVFANRGFSERANRRLQLVRSNGSKLLRERVTAVLARIMVVREADVLLDSTQIVLSIDSLDITDEAIARLDEVFPEMPLPSIDVQE